MKMLFGLNVGIQSIEKTYQLHKSQKKRVIETGDSKALSGSLSVPRCHYLMCSLEQTTRGANRSMFLVNQFLTGNGVERTMLTSTLSRRRTDEVTLYLKVVVDPAILTTPVAITILTRVMYLLGEKYTGEKD